MEKLIQRIKHRILICGLTVVVVGCDQAQYESKSILDGATPVALSGDMRAQGIERDEEEELPPPEKMDPIAVKISEIPFDDGKDKEKEREGPFFDLQSDSEDHAMLKSKAGWVYSVLNGHEVSCVDPQGCHNSVGTMYITSEEQMSSGGVQYKQCTVSLVDKNIILTNSHCIPDYLRENPDWCSDFLAVKFLNKKVIKCKKLIFSSDLSFKKTKSDRVQDYAFLELEKNPNLEPLRFASRVGVGDNISISIPKVNPLEKGGAAEVAECKAVHGRYYLRYSQHRYSPVVSAIGCVTQKGNSGSPVLNSRGEIIGVHQSMAILDGYEVFVKKLSDVNVSYSGQAVPYVTSFTNASCIWNPVTRDKVPSSCEKAKKLTLGQCRLKAERRNFLKSVQSRVVDFEREYAASKGVWYNIQVDVWNSGFFIDARPRCVDASKPLKKGKFEYFQLQQFKASPVLSPDLMFIKINNIERTRTHENTIEVFSKPRQGYYGYYSGTGSHLPACKSNQKHNFFYVKSGEKPQTWSQLLKGLEKGTHGEGCHF